MTTDVTPSSPGQRDGCATTETVSQEVERALRNSSHCGLRKVRCKFADGVATLTGDVSSYYLKQIAQTIVGRLKQVRQVENQLRVVGLSATRFDS